ncbi:MAG: carbohydrate ABC transporter substrate-binding protein [Chloroflexi bacterium]|nr:carbohydrate ABC transporter substrate-binding protein [Chloroflexota bacterium]
MSNRKFYALLLLTAVLLTLGIASLSVHAQDVSGDLEIFSWWVGGGEAAGLEALIARFGELYPDVNVINSAVAGGSGVNAQAVLSSRMQGGDPPDTFQVHAGSELNDTWVAAGVMEPLNFIYEEEGWTESYPEGLISLISDAEGNIYSVPVNIHRSNVMWYVPANLEQWGVTVPATWEEFVTTTCPALLAADVTPLAVGQAWTQMHLWESVALGVLGPEAYAGLWTGDTDWASAEVTSVFETYGQVLACSNSDRDGLSWQDASQRVINGEAAFNVMGDWAAGYFLVDLALEPGVGFAWSASPGTEGAFLMLSDTFGLPVGAPNREAAVAWLRFLGSAEAQDIFNPLKGSLPANTDADIENTELYNAYFQDAYTDWTTNAIVGSLAHGAVGYGEFKDGFSNILAVFATDGDVAAAQAIAVELWNEVYGE